jgi:hypothetical protein
VPRAHARHHPRARCLIDNVHHRLSAWIIRPELLSIASCTH